MTTSAMSRGFFEFVKSIGEAKSKQEEDRIIEKELHVLKSKMAGRQVAPRQMREYLIRMVYVEMLGHDASFGHIHGVKLTRTSKLADKRVGYLACSLCLHKNHELMLLLVGGLQTDLQSQNQLEVATALIVACKLINEDTIPAVLPLVNKLLSHSEANIRKKAIMTLHRFWELNPASVSEISEKAKKMLCDKDPAVMGSSLYLLFELCEKDSNQYKDLVSSFVSILKQIIEHRLPKDYDYHRMPAPWMQIKLLQILALLGNADKTASEGMYEVLHEVMRRADIGINVGYAIIYECVRTVTAIFPNAQLLGEAAKCTSRFITSDNHNLKYLGINALASIVQVNPAAANEHQMVVIDCLEDRDETLRRKTLDLLYRMTNSNNVNVICTKLIASLKDSIDVFLRTELIEKITSLAEKFAPDTVWYIETMSEVFELGGELVQSQFAHNFIRTLATGISENAEDEEAEEDIAQYAADFFLEQLDRSRIPNILLKVIAWVLGEYGQHATGQPISQSEEEEKEQKAPISVMQVIRKLWEVVEKQGEDSGTRAWTMSATCKLSRHLQPVPEEVTNIVQKYQASVNSELQQLSHELRELIKEKEVMANIFKQSAINDEIEIDESLPFLDNYVKQALGNGAREYDPPQLDEIGDDNKGHGGGMGGILYQHVTEKEDQASMLETRPLPQINSFDNNDEEEAPQIQTKTIESDTGIKSSSVKKWGPSGFNDGDDEQKSSQINDNNNNNNNNNNPTTPTVHKGNPVITAREYTPENTQVKQQQHQQQPVKEMTEKERLAHTIFSQDGSNDYKKKRAIRLKKTTSTASISTSTSTNNNKKKQDEQKESSIPQSKKPQQSQQQKQQQQRQGNSTNDILGLEFNNNNNNNNNNSSDQKSPVIDDLLSFVDDYKVNNNQQTAKSQAKPQAMKPQSHDPLDFLGDFGDITQTNNNNNNNNDTYEIFSLSNNASPNNNNKNDFGMNGENQQTGFAALPQLKAKIGTFPRSHPIDQFLNSNSHVSISYFKIYKQQQTSICVFVSNTSNSNLNNLQLTCQTDNQFANIQVGIDVNNCIPQPKLLNAHCSVFQSLNAYQTCCIAISIGASNPQNVIVPVGININIQYNNNQTINSKVNVALSDLLRPNTISTDDFGANWLKLDHNEAKIVVRPSSCKNLDDYVQKITKIIHLYHIKTINSECIAAGQLFSFSNVNNSVVVLVHCKAENNGYTLLIRTLNANASKALVQELKQIMQ